MKQNCPITGEDHKRDVEIDLLEICPACHNGIMPKFEAGHLVINQQTARGTIFILLYCQHCKDYFICRYDIQSGGGSNLIYAYPNTPQYTSFSDNISELSPQFVKIYNQSITAETDGLDELAGMGYRKSLEFIIKDYLINIQNEDEVAIKRLELGKCIAKISDEKILTLSKGATWLGNDETHYLRKHEDYNIQHLKLFITTVVNYVDGDFAYRKALGLTQRPM